MSAALPEGRYANSQGNPVPRQSRLMAGEGPPPLNQEHARTHLLSLRHGQGVASDQYFRQSYQQGRQVAGFQPNYTSGAIAYGYPPSFGQSYPQPLQQLHGQQATAYNHVGAPYYLAQPNLPQQTYDNAAAVIFQQEHNYRAPSHAPGAPAMHDTVAAGLPGSAQLPTGSTCKSHITATHGTAYLLTIESCEQA